MAADFRSALYLGLRHPWRTLRPWPALTTGQPPVLDVPAGSRTVAGALADLVGAESALLARSTLHALIDVAAVVGRRAGRVLVDAGAYPLAGTALAATGLTSERFGHHDPADLARRLARPAPPGPPLVVADGICPCCGRVAPLAAYADLARGAGGVLLVDDSQALGVLGSRRPGGSPYGSGGGGALRWAAVPPTGTVTVASLAKGFGVPVAVLAGERGLVGRVARDGPLRLHASGPSAADVAAAHQAMATNLAVGDRLRARLLRLVQRLRAGLARLGLPSPSGEFPVQAVGPFARPAAAALWSQLRRRGVTTLLTRPCRGAGLMLTVLLTAGHQTREVDAAVYALAAASAAGTGRPALTPPGWMEVPDGQPAALG